DVADQAQRRAEATTDAALAWFREHKDRKFFLWVHYFDSHFPYDPPGRFATLYDPGYQGRANGSMDYLDDVWQKRVFPSSRDRDHIVSLYDGEISYMDMHLGRLLKEFDRSGLMDNSVLIVVADHGESLGEHGYDFDHGLYVYDASIRVPLLIHVPRLAEGTVIVQQVETLDILPTILDVMGHPIPDVVEGRSLKPLLAGDTSWTERTVFSEASKPWNAEGESGEIFRNERKAKCARTRDWKYIYTPYARSRELYELSKDPAETVNLVAKRPDLAAEMEKHLQFWAQAPRERQPADDLVSQDPETLEKLRSLGYLQ
ncbi:MAG: sulfatase-like hydrolase/transferase, partial [Candidatus Eisenbacteria sp.]|nr:sulfatase-like hydrolase/transferase [Candidatus Eisenbacteria bacterium]